jgi:hypothetical protein
MNRVAPITARCVAVAMIMLGTFAADAQQQEYWVRPEGERYGARDGGSYANAFSGFTALGRHHLAGKTIWVCGEHRDTLVVDDSDVTVRLDCAEDPGTVLGSERLTVDDWVGAGDAPPYRIVLPQRPKVVVVNGRIYPERSVSELSSGYFAVSVGERPRGYTLHFADDLRAMDVEVGQREFGIRIGSDQRTRVHGFTVLGGGVGWIRNVGAGAAEHPQGKGIGAMYDGWPRENYGGHWRIEGVGFAAIQTQAVHVHGTSVPDDITVRNCRVLDIGGEGIYVKSVSGRVLIEDNVIGQLGESHFGWAGDGGAFSGDGIDLGGSDQDAARTVEVRRNRIANVRGTGIIVHSANGVVEDNSIEDAYYEGGTEEKGCLRIDPVYDGAEIEVERNRCRNSRGHGIIVRGKLGGGSRVRIGANIVELGSTANGYAAALHSSLNARGILYRNNTFVGGDYGLFVMNAGADLGEFGFEGNIVTNARQPIALAPAGMRGRVILRGNVPLDSRSAGSLELLGNTTDHPQLDGDYAPTFALRALPEQVDWPAQDAMGRSYHAVRRPGAIQR